MRKRNKRAAIAGVLLAAGATVGLAACNDNGGVHSVSNDPVQTAPAHPVKPKPLAPGEYKDGTKVGVSNLSRFTSSDVASPANVSAVKFSVDLHNGTKSPIDNGMLNVECVANGKTADPVFDEGYDGNGTGHTLPGQSYSYTAACEVPPGATKIQIEITPNNGDSIENDTASVFVKNLP